MMRIIDTVVLAETFGFPPYNGLAAKRRADQLAKVPNCKLVRLSRWL